MIAQPKLPVNSAYGATAVKERRKTVSAVFGEAVYCVQHELHKRVARTLCSFAVATRTRCVETKYQTR